MRIFNTRTFKERRCEEKRKIIMAEQQQVDKYKYSFIMCMFRLNSTKEWTSNIYQQNPPLHHVCLQTMICHQLNLHLFVRYVLIFSIVSNFLCLQCYIIYMSHQTQDLSCHPAPTTCNNGKSSIKVYERVCD